MRVSPEGARALRQIGRVNPEVRTSGFVGLDDFAKWKGHKYKDTGGLCIFDNQEDDMIDIDGCIEGICLGKKFLDNSERIVKLAEHLICSNQKFNIQINTDAFGVIASTDGGYDAWPIHPNIDVRIVEIINSLNNLLL